MIPRKPDIEARRTLLDESSEIFELDSLLEALLYLEERELVKEVKKYSDSSGTRFLFLSATLTARLFKQIADLIPAACLEVTAKEAELSVTVSAAKGSAVTDEVALKIARNAHLSGFTARHDGEHIFLGAELHLDRTLAIYALCKKSLVDIFKKYF